MAELPRSMFVYPAVEAGQSPRGPCCVLCGRAGYLHGPEFDPLTGRGLLAGGATGLRCAGVASCTARAGENRRTAPRRWSFTRGRLIGALTRHRPSLRNPESAADAIIGALEDGESAAREAVAIMAKRERAERGGYPAGGRLASELPPPPASLLAPGPAWRTGRAQRGKGYPMADAAEDEIQWTSKSMSNFDHSQDDGLEEDLRAGKRGTHSAWNFNGQVWYDPVADVFREDVWVHHAKMATLSAPTLDDLMRVVNDEFGWD